MRIALEDRQAVVVRANATDQHVVAVVQQVLSSNGCPDVGRCFCHELHGIGRCNVFEDHFKRRETLDYAAHVFVDELLLAVEDVDLATRYFTVDQ